MADIKKNLRWAIPAIAIIAAAWGGTAYFQHQRAEEHQARIEQEQEQKRVYQERLTAQEDSVMTYVRELIDNKEFDRARAQITFGEDIKPGVAFGDLEKSLERAYVKDMRERRFAELQSRFANQQYLPVEGETLWSIAPVYQRALTGKPGSEQEIGNLWMDMVKYRRAEGKNSEMIYPGVPVNLPYAVE